VIVHELAHSFFEHLSTAQKKSYESFLGWKRDGAGGLLARPGGFVNEDGRDSADKDDSVHERQDWLYLDSKTGFQIAALGFDSKSQTLISKLAVPKEGESESKLDFIITKKFSRKAFDKIQRPHADLII
jgi:hypothetical protein